MTRWPRLKGLTYQYSFLPAGKQGGFAVEEHPGLADLDSRLCSCRLPGPRHLPVQFWNRPSQVPSFLGVLIFEFETFLPIQKAHQAGRGRPNSCQADFQPNPRGGGKVARKVREASGEALQGTQPLSRCKACNKLKVGELLSTLNCYSFDQRKITLFC